MPPTNSPTLRQRRLGTELRKLRERAGLNTTGAAARLGVSQARVSMVETGRTPISADRIRSTARAYDCADEPLIEALSAMTGRRVRGWWEEYREHLPANLIDLVELEHHAVSLRVALFVHIPALLQTTDHARAIFRTVVPPLRQYEIEHRLTHRIKRQAILYRDNPTPYLVTIHEAALRMGFGGRAVTIEQLRHLVEMSELPHVTVRVIPFGNANFPGAGQSITYAAGPVPQIDTVQLDSHHGCEFLDSEAQLAKYRSVMDRLDDCALAPEKSRDLVHSIANDL
ncbi:helix-turn-helix domain-containing protein [Streptomyces sp. NPDC002643]